ncbi:hypothetical protein FHS13_003306 [Nocardiopsis algeriensis]|uniref:Uncharacterized protein n=1 Tax=Nocardiopsis algeriensis TaxID=1478215 RepID=A0A841IYM6_9ACTN|nr:hypothetical protein [Nocardiopsis algeriensis]
MLSLPSLSARGGPSGLLRDALPVSMLITVGDGFVLIHAGLRNNGNVTSLLSNIANL